MSCWNETRSEGLVSLSQKGEELKDCSVFCLAQELLKRKKLHLSKQCWRRNYWHPMPNWKTLMLKTGTSDKTNKFLLFQINNTLRHQTQVLMFCITLLKTPNIPLVFKTQHFLVFKVALNTLPRKLNMSKTHKELQLILKTEQMLCNGFLLMTRKSLGKATTQSLGYQPQT